MGLDPTALVGVDATPDVYPPLAGTTIQAADVAAGEQALLNNITSLGLGGAVVNIEDRAIPMLWTGVTDTGAADYWAATSYGGATQVPAPTGALTLAMQVLEIPHGANVTGIAAVIDPAAHGAAPANLPSLSLVQVNAQTGATTSLGSVTDVWNGGLYVNAHPLAITGLDVDIDLDLYRYVLVFQSEYGANSQAGLVVVGPTWTGTARSNRVNEDP